MTPEIGLLLAMLVVALVFFATEWISADVTALGLLLTLTLTGLLPANRAFAGFGSDTVMLILGLLILTAALERTGVVELTGRVLMRYAGDAPERMLLVVMVASALLSSFMSNTASTAFFLPVVLGIAARSKTSPSKLLMPLAFSSVLASSVTLVATSTNIVISGMMQDYGLEGMGMFELAPVGVPIAVAGLVYMGGLGRRLIPDRTSSLELTESFGMRKYLTEAILLPDSPLAGKTLAQAALGAELDLTVLQVVREKNRYLAPYGALELQPGDVLVVEGLREDILKIKDKAGVDIKADVMLSDPDLQSEDLRLVEVLILPRSPLIGRTLQGYRFSERYGLQVLAINRRSETIHRKLSQVPLRMGDVLLVQGHRADIAALARDRTTQILGVVEERRPNLDRARIAVLLFVLAIGAASAELVSLPVAVLLAAVGVFLTRCISPDEAYRQVEWKAIILIGSMLGFGVAMEHTGTATYLASRIVDLTEGIGPIGLLTGFFLLTMLLTQPMSNQAAAVVLLPVAIQTANQLHLNPRTFAMMIAVGASCSYLTPLEPSCLLVYGPGRYRFADFLKVGGLLTIVIYVISILLVPRVWPVDG